MKLEEIAKKIYPFNFFEPEDEYEDTCSVTLYAGNYKPEIFEPRLEDGFEGGGYDWESLAIVFLKEKCPELKEKIEFDSEASMFCAYSTDKTALEQFALAFKAACEDDVLIQDLFSRAEPLF